MSCTFKYIDNANIASEKKELLNNAHLDAMKQIASAQYDGELLFSNYVTVGKNRALVLQRFLDTKEKIQKRQKQLEFLDDLNKELKSKFSSEKIKGKLLAGAAPATLFGDKKYDLVYVNLSPFTDTEVKLYNLDFASDEDYNKYFDMMVSDIYNPDYIKNIDEVELILKDTVKSEKTIELLDDLYNRLDSYGNNIIYNKNVNSEFSNVKDSHDLLKNFLYLLKNNKDNNISERVHTITNVVTKGYQTLQYLNSRYKNTIKPLILSVENTELENYDSQVAKVASVLSEASTLMNTLDPLKQLLSEIIDSVQWNFWSNYNTNRIERELFNRFPEKREIIENILKSKATNINEIEVAFITEGFSTEQLKNVLDIINSSLLTSRNYIMEAYQNMLSLYGKLQSDLAKAHYDLVGTVLYNEQVKSAGDNFDALSEKGVLKSKEELIKQLKVATSDVSFLNSWLSGGAKLDDPIARLFAFYVLEPIRMAEMTNRQQALNSENDLENFGLSLNNSDLRKSYEELMIHDIDYLDPESGIEEVPDDYDEKKDPDAYKKSILSLFGKRFFMQKGKAFITEIDRHKLSYTTRLFMHTVEDRATDCISKLGTEISGKSQAFLDFQILENYGLVDLTIQDGKIIPYTTRKKYNKNIFKSILIKDFFDNKDSIKDKKEINELLANHLETLSIKEILTELNKKQDSSFYNYIKNNSYSNKKIENIDGEYLQRYLGYSLNENLIGIDTEGNYVEVNLKKDKYGYSVVTPNIVSLIQLQNDFVNLSKEYYSKEYKTLPFHNEQFKNYYEYLYNRYKESNEKLGSWKLRFNLIPFVPVSQTKSLWEKGKKLLTVSGLKDLVSSLDFKEENVKIRKAWIDGEYVQVDHEGKPSAIPHYISNVDIQNNPIRELVPRYTRNYYAGDTEIDLFVNLYIFGNSSNTYYSVAKSEPLTRIFKTLLNSDPTLGIEYRQALVKDSIFNNLIFKTTNQVLTKQAENSSSALLSFIDHYIYGIQSDDAAVFGKFSAKKLTKLLKTSIAYQVLANNWVAAGSNLTIASVSNFAAAMGRRHNLDTEIMRNAYGKYITLIPKFIKDFAQTSRKDQSLYTQLSYLFDANKGDFEEGRGHIELSNLKDRIGRGILFTSSIAPEHMNQMTMFIGFVNAYEVLPGLKFIDMIKHEEGKAIEFDIEKYNTIAENLGKPKISSEDFEQKIKPIIFRKVSRLLYEANGQYDLLDKAKIERSYLFSVAYLFQKWLYPGFRIRYGVNNLYDPEVGEVEEEGYMLTYMKDMLAQNDLLINEFDNLSFIESFKKYVEVKGIKTLPKALATKVGKQVVWTINRLSKVFGMENKKMEDWIFGDATEEVRNRLNRAYFEVAIYATTFLIGWMLTSAISDDDDDTLTKNLLLQVKRLQNDVGFFINPLTMADKLYLKVEDPFAIKRTYQTNSGVLKQLLLGKYSDEGWDWNINDRYDRSGNGYEKGDLKLSVKARKAFFAPYHQIIRLMNPQEQLNYLNMIYDN